METCLALTASYLSANEETLYATNGATVVAFDVEADGSLSNQRDFGQLQGGQGGDGSAIDSEGRLYVATGRSADVFAPDGTFLGSIPGPQGMHGVAFGGEDKKDALRYRFLRFLGNTGRTQCYRGH